MLARIARLLLAAILLASTPALAGNEWRIVEVSGDVWILRQGGETRLAAAGAVFPNGATLATSPTGRALLVHGEEAVVAGPNTVLALLQRGGHTRVVQISGSADFEVERQNVQHFTVETPFLAAVVKGTHFAVEVSPGGAQVGVDRGVVQVSSPGSRQLTDLEAEMAAIVTADNPAIGLLAGRPVVFQAETPRAFPRLPTVTQSGMPSVAGQPQSPNSVVTGADDEPFGNDEADIEQAMASGSGGEAFASLGDHDRGHGNDPDGVDEDNPGRGHNSNN